MADLGKVEKWTVAPKVPECYALTTQNTALLLKVGLQKISGCTETVNLLLGFHTV